MNATPSLAPSAGDELEIYKAELFRAFTEKESHTGTEEPTELLLTETIDTNNPADQATRIQALVMSSIGTAAKRGLIVSGGHPVLLEDEELRDQLELHPFFNGRGRLAGDQLLPHISVRRATTHDIGIIDQARRSVTALQEETLRNLRNTLVPRIKMQAAVAFERTNPFM